MMIIHDDDDDDDDDDDGDGDDDDEDGDDKVILNKTYPLRNYILSNAVVEDS